jgi:multiple sugar transport system permease protein
MFIIFQGCGIKRIGAKGGNPVRKSMAVTIVTTVLVLLWTLVPLYWFGKVAFQHPADMSAFPPHFYPKRVNITGFVNILGFSYRTSSGEVFIPSGMSDQILDGLRNSFILSVFVTVLTMVVAVPLSYTFGRLEFKHKNALIFAVLLSVALPPISVTIPFYILFTNAKLTGTLRGLIIVDLTVTIPFVTWMLLGFFRNLPPVENLARIDGYTRLGAFFSVILPMGRIGIVVGAVISFLFTWNEYTFSQILATGTKATTIAASISGFLNEAPEPGHLSAALIYSMIPPFIVVFLLQKHIAKMHIVEPLG